MAFGTESTPLIGIMTIFHYRIRESSTSKRKERRSISDDCTSSDLKTKDKFVSIEYLFQAIIFHWRSNVVWDLVR